ncbi:putative leader peptide [Actinomycetospora aeridis]
MDRAAGRLRCSSAMSLSVALRTRRHVDLRRQASAICACVPPRR